ncbi:hypothetical protein [Flavobacterium ardleyense]|uniref:hypothetical protein n=1 Tax=Flavobacterium ardleyense TaxID=2038737 RepID=UPI00298C3578|nr:hypothetical protein [Flavobacterium ardleyense]
MTKKNFNIFLISLGITIFGLLLDSDAKEPSMIMRFVEFFAMTGLIFIISFSINKLYSLTRKKSGPV